MISGIWTPLQTVLERPFQVGQALVPALFEAGLSLTLAAVLSTVGIGFDTGTTPFIQQIVKSTQAVLTAVTTLNPINVLNAIQHGIADVALNFVTQLNAFTTGTLPFVRDMLVRALQAGSPAFRAVRPPSRHLRLSDAAARHRGDRRHATTPVKDASTRAATAKTEPAVGLHDGRGRRPTKP